MAKIEDAKLTEHDGYAEVNHPSSKYKIVMGDFDNTVGILDKEKDQDILDLSREEFWRLYEMMTLAAHRSHRRPR